MNVLIIVMSAMLFVTIAYTYRLPNEVLGHRCTLLFEIVRVARTLMGSADPKQFSASDDAEL